MTDGGNKMTSSTKIPVGEMAKDMLDKIFPHLTPEQIEAMKAGKPVPPSPDWVAGAVAKAEPHLSALRKTESTPGDQRRIQELNQKLEDTYVMLREKARKDAILEQMVATMASGPLVSCIMLFKEKNRMRRARKAVNQFVAQSYPNKQLVIINNSDTPVTNVPNRHIKELTFEVSDDIHTDSLGMMRNAALKVCDGTIVYPHWDDDDVYDPHLLAFLVQNYVMKNYGVFPEHHKAVTLQSEIRINIENSVVYQHTETDGLPGNMLVPFTNARYADLHGEEGMAFWQRYWAIKSHVCADGWPINTLKMSVFDGNNVLPVEKFMVDHATPEHEGRWHIGEKELEHMRVVLEGFGVKAEARPPVSRVEVPVG